VDCLVQVRFGIWLPSRTPQNPLGKSLLDNLQHFRGVSYLRLANQQMKVVRHDDVTQDHEPIALPRVFQNAQEEIAA
jgi:hypothetical protein